MSEETAAAAAAAVTAALASRISVLEYQAKEQRGDIVEMKSDVKEILAISNKAAGGLKMGLAFASLMAFVVSIVSVWASRMLWK